MNISVCPQTSRLIEYLSEVMWVVEGNCLLTYANFSPLFSIISKIRAEEMSRMDACHIIERERSGLLRRIQGDAQETENDIVIRNTEILMDTDPIDLLTSIESFEDKGLFPQTHSPTMIYIDDLSKIFPSWVSEKPCKTVEDVVEILPRSIQDIYVWYSRTGDVFIHRSPWVAERTFFENVPEVSFGLKKYRDKFYDSRVFSREIYYDEDGSEYFSEDKHQESFVLPEEIEAALYQEIEEKMDGQENIW